MLNLFYGPDQYKLADQLLKNLDHQPPENVLSPEVFIVQNHGMGQWLTHHIAQNRGIAGNLKFEFPSERIWQLLRLMDPDIPEQLPSDRQPMVWSLMKLLKDPEVLSELEALAYYLESEDSDRRLMRTWKLSSKIADVFDQYLIYRPDLILGWQQGQLVEPNNSTEQWQAALWNRLIDHWSSYSEGKWLHRAELQRELLTRIQDEGMGASELPERLTVFGVSAMPTEFIRILVSLSHLVDVNFYQIRAGQVKQNNAEATNPLLLSLGKHGSSFSKQFASVIKQAGCPINRHYIPPEELSKNDLCTTLKDDLQDDQLPASDPTFSADQSIQMHSCHSAMREVEVLYDQLLHLLDGNPGLSPDEILIMTPDIESFAPMIEAVFGNPDGGQTPIPYSIDSSNREAEYGAVSAFLSILDLAESRFKVTDTLDLIDSEPIGRAFSFTGDDLNRLSRWVQDGNIKWGIDGDFKEKIGLPASKRFTWKSGLNNMLAGYAMKPEDSRLYGDIFPYEEIEGTETGELMGRFYRLMRALFDIKELAATKRSPQDWAEELQAIPALFFEDDETYYRQISNIRNALQQLADNAILGGYQEKVSLAVVRQWLEKQLQRQSSGGGRIGRGLSFSSLEPMRSIPFKFIGMIGMNEGAFPRSKIPIEFDFIHLRPRPGDPLQSEEDRYLFLENILSAGQGLYFSYEGQHNRQDADFPPSVVLKEFIDYLTDYYGIREEELITKHRLQAFSPHYFKENELFSYSQTQLAVSKKLADPTSGSEPLFSNRLPEAKKERKQLSVDDLIHFFRHPPKYVMQHRLGIMFSETEVISEDREPFAINKLDEYIIGQELLDRFLKDRSLEQYRAVLEARNALPEGRAGDLGYRQKVDEVQEFGSKIQEKLDGKQLDDQNINITIDGFHLMGSLSTIYEPARIDYRFGKARSKDKIAWWIRHLLFQLEKPAGHSGRSRFYSWNNSSFKEYFLAPVEEPLPILKELLQLYWQGLHSPLPFYGKSSYAYAEEALKKQQPEKKALVKARKKWETCSYGGNTYPGEGDDPYNKLAAGNRPFATPDFSQISRTFWAPYFKALNKEEV